MGAAWRGGRQRIVGALVLEEQVNEHRALAGAGGGEQEIAVPTSEGLLHEAARVGTGWACFRLVFRLILGSQRARNPGRALGNYAVITESRPQGGIGLPHDNAVTLIHPVPAFYEQAAARIRVASFPAWTPSGPSSDAVCGPIALSVSVPPSCTTSPRALPWLQVCRRKSRRCNPAGRPSAKCRELLTQ